MTTFTTETTDSSIHLLGGRYSFSLKPKWVHKHTEQMVGSVRKTNDQGTKDCFKISTTADYHRRDTSPLQLFFSRF